jgi:hypothetical protein
LDVRDNHIPAFLQDGNIFWPPKIGAKPEKSKSKKADEAKDAHHHNLANYLE